MPRPKHCRQIAAEPTYSCFKPNGVALETLKTVRLSIDGLEAIRLAHLERLTASEAAIYMGVSRHTFGRTLAEALHQVAEALVFGNALLIDGGAYVITPPGTDQSPLGSKKIRKIAISSEGKTMDDPVSAHFGRASGFLIVSIDDGSFEWRDNSPAQRKEHGAGTDAAEQLIALGVDALLTGYVGPKAQDLLSNAGIHVCPVSDAIPARNAVKRLLEQVESNAILLEKQRVDGDNAANARNKEQDL